MASETSNSVNVINPSGKVVSIDADQLQQAITLGGYKEASAKDLRYQEIEEKYGGDLEQQAKAFGEGVLKGVPIVGGKILKAITEKEAREAREELYPGSEMIGEGASVAGQLALPFSPLAGIAKAGRAAEGLVSATEVASPIFKTAQTIAAKASGSAVDTALYELGREVNESDLGETDLTGEMALAALKRGAVAGFVGGALFSGATSASKAIKESAMFNSLKEGGHLSGGVASGVLKKAANKFIPETMGLKDLVVEKIDKSITLRAVDYAARATAKVIDSGVTDIFSAEALPLVTSSAFSRSDKSPQGEKEKRIEEFNKLQNEITELKNNPDRFIRVLSDSTDALSSAAPNLTASVMASNVRAVNYLDQILPKPPPQAALSAPWVANQTEISSFIKGYEAVKNPTIVLKQIKDGTLSQKSVEAVRVVYPQMYKTMQVEILDRLTLQNNKIPNKTRNMLTLFFGEPFTNSIKPQAILRNQMIMNGPSQQSGMDTAAPRAGKTTQGGLGKLDSADRILTSMQRSSERKS
jgi:hypothetical protein